MRTFYSHLDWPGRGTMSHLFSYFYKLREVDEPNHADIIIWNGGEDISSSIYLEEPIMRSIPASQTRRDKDEIALFNEYKNNGDKFLLGICRGAQLLNCLNGGKLYQDVDGHGQTHPMVDLRTNEVVDVTSTHHQQMVPAPKNGHVIGVSSRSTYKNGERGVEHFYRDNDLKHGVDVEIMWYPETRSLCIQGHPEYVPESRFSKYTFGLVTELFYKSIRKVA